MGRPKRQRRHKWIPKRGQLWIEQDLKQTHPQGPTHRGYLRLPRSGELLRLALWLEEAEDGRTYLEGEISAVRPPHMGQNTLEEAYWAECKTEQEKQALKKARSPGRKPRVRHIQRAAAKLAPE